MNKFVFFILLLIESFTATCNGNNCGVHNCGTNQFCCKRSGFSASRCYYDRPFMGYSCKYIHASNNNAASTIASTLMSSTKATFERSSLATGSNCGLFTCENNKFCCKTYSFSSPSCYNYMPFTYYTCRHVFNSESSSFPAVATASTIYNSDNNCGDNDCSDGQYCCKSYSYSNSYCYFTQPFSSYSCKLISDSKSIQTYSQQTTSLSAYNCGSYSCSGGQYCCKLYSNYSVSACYYSKPTSYYSCQEIGTSNFIESDIDTYYGVSITAGEIIGITFGGLALIVIGVLACVYCCVRLKKKHGTSIGRRLEVEAAGPSSEQPGITSHHQQGSQYVRLHNITLE